MRRLSEIGAAWKLGLVGFAAHGFFFVVGAPEHCASLANPLMAEHLFAASAATAVASSRRRMEGSHSFATHAGLLGSAHTTHGSGLSG